MHFLDSSQVPAISVWKNFNKESNLNRMRINPALLYIHFYQHRRHSFFHNLDRIFYSLLALEIPTKVAFVVFSVLICPDFFILSFIFSRSFWVLCFRSSLFRSRRRSLVLIASHLRQENEWFFEVIFDDHQLCHYFSALNISQPSFAEVREVIFFTEPTSKGL